MNENPVSKQYKSYNRTIVYYIICAIEKQIDENKRWMILLDT